MPWYLGIEDSPDAYRRGTDRYDPGSAWWRFRLLGMLANVNYAECIGVIRPAWEEQEEEALSMQEAVEKTALELYDENPERARAYLTAYSVSRGMMAFEKAGQLNEECIGINALAGR